MPGSVTVTFHPAGVTVEVPAGTTLLEAARLAGLPLPSTCGGRGTCGDCAVRILEGDAPPPGGLEQASLAGAPPSVRLACLTRVTSPLTVRAVAALAADAGAPPALAASTRPSTVAAVDLGTTTIAAALLDAAGLETAEATAPNPQRTFGGDVASRISAAMSGAASELASLAALGIDDALTSAGVALGGVGRIVVAGNTAMTHLALGAEVAGLAAHPYRGSVPGIARTTGARLGLTSVAPDADVVFLPAMASFVGGDATAGVLALGLDETRAPRVLLDLGTNAEVAISAEGRLTVASAAAGPAFEAAGLACGAPARLGAVRAVAVRDGELVLDVIGGVPADALCGSGALSLVAELLHSGHLDGTGRMTAEGPLAERFHHRGDVLALQVDGSPGADRDVYLTQLDVRELQLAKAAVGTALELTLEAAGVGWGDVTAVAVAGALGAKVDAHLLAALGVLPAEAAAKVRAVGDSALAGAVLVAHDPALEARASAIAAGARGVDLAADPRFQRTFLAHTAFVANGS